MLKLYVVVRSDMAAGMIAAQALHAAVELALLQPEQAKAWREASQNVVVLSARGGALALADALARARAAGGECVRFTEPDMDGAETAFACFGDEPIARALSSLPLALKNYAWDPALAA